jgi:hypothetical protein
VPLNRADRRLGENDAAEAVIDAEFETLDEGEPPVGSARSKHSAQKPTPPGGMALFGNEAVLTKPGDDRVAFYGFSVLLVALSFWVSGGYTLAQRAAVPQSPLQLAKTQWAVVPGEKHSVLVVDGVVRNPGQTAAAGLPVAITVLKTDGSKLHYTVGTARHRLAPGQDLTFSARLELAPSLDSAAVNVETVTMKMAEAPLPR